MKNVDAIVQDVVRSQFEQFAELSVASVETIHADSDPAARRRLGNFRRRDGE